MRESSMKKIIIILGSLLAISILLVAPTLSAIGFKLKQKGSLDYNKEEIKEAILERIYFLQEQKIEPTIQGLSWEDPDGPLEGGLDDYSDYINLLMGFTSIKLILFCIKDGIIRNAETLYQMIISILEYGINTFDTLVAFGEAFDVYEMPPGNNR
jgi:hypothetical protein